MKEKSIFLNYIGDSPKTRLLQYLIEGSEFDYTLTDMLRARVSWGTLNKLIPNLLALDIISKTRKIGRATLYQINRNNSITNNMIRLYDEIINLHLAKIGGKNGKQRRKEK